MSLKIKTIAESVAGTGLNLVVYGDAGVGKTRMIGSLPGKVLIVSAEGGLLSLGDCKADVVEVSSMAEVREVYKVLAQGDHGYDWVALDSFSEVCETLLSEEKEKTKDPRQAYGAVIEHGIALARAFRDLPIGVYFTAKSQRVKDDATGRISYEISMPGAKLGASLPFLFDEVFFAFQAKDKDSGEIERWLQTSADQRANAKDRSGALDAYEPAHLGNVINKIRGDK